MKYSEVGATISTAITSNPDTAPLGAPIVFTYLLDEVATNTQNAAALREIGVAIEIEVLGWDKAFGTASRAAGKTAIFMVRIAENPKVAHTPTGDDLVELVTGVVESIGMRGGFPESHAKSHGLHENGYVLHEILFSAPVLSR